ncbi:hypothetical protein LTR37_002717 [Vermiconidia calcicola]|uniref:Uncharacterized protein n=1 Tax=Vermiconidia calcicola TaxID=1690605 RepID=A0ACC3NS69_9PEZI|nr:hypothetical protein LTR37_002717 [Vermiconidia calcicola]
MSEPIPESIPTSSDRRSHRPTKKRALTPTTQQSAQVEALFANPDREISLPSSTSTKNGHLAPPEIVANVQGSSAGAGSGEFHVYKASRRREYERLRLMDEEVEREEKERAFRQKQEELRQRDEEKARRNREKRAKVRARKEKGKVADGIEGMDLDGKGGVNGNGNGVGGKKKLGAAKVAMLGRGDRVDEEGGGGQMNGNREVAEEAGGITVHDDD